eukprot:scaffold48983_cov17-Tisochrysis_lutea.AAC.3
MVIDGMHVSGSEALEGKWRQLDEVQWPDVRGPVGLFRLYHKHVLGKHHKSALPYLQPNCLRPSMPTRNATEITVIGESVLRAATA